MTSQIIKDAAWQGTRIHRRATPNRWKSDRWHLSASSLLWYVWLCVLALAVITVTLHAKPHKVTVTPIEHAQRMSEIDRRIAQELFCLKQAKNSGAVLDRLAEAHAHQQYRR